MEHEEQTQEEQDFKVPVKLTFQYDTSAEYEGPLRFDIQVRETVTASDWDTATVIAQERAREKAQDVTGGKGNAGFQEMVRAYGIDDVIAWAENDCEVCDGTESVGRNTSRSGDPQYDEDGPCPRCADGSKTGSLVDVSVAEDAEDADPGR